MSHDEFELVQKHEVKTSKKCNNMRMTGNVEYFLFQFNSTSLIVRKYLNCT